MAAPPPMPLGLQQLLPLGFVRVKERRSIFSNKFLVTNDAGDKIFTVREDTSGLACLVGGKDRPFNMDFFDGNEQNVVSLRRPYCFSGCSKMEVTVCGVVASVVRQEATFLKPVLSINDPNDTQVLRIKGLESFGDNVKYELLSVDKTPIGTIKRHWKWTEPDQYHVTFPSDLDVRYKLTVIGTCILIVMNVFHPSCTDCANDKIIVTVGNEEELATVISEEPNIYKPTYDVCDSQDQRMLRIKGRFSCFSSPEYEVETASETAVGKIVREWHCFQPNEYHLTFPVDLDVRQKCALIATCVFSDTRSC